MKKRIIFLLFILLILVNLVIIILNSFDESYVMFGTTTKVYYKNGNYSKIKHISKPNSKLNYSKVNLFYENEFIPAYINVTYSENLYGYEIYNEDYEKLSVYPMIFSSEDININMKVGTSENLTDTDKENINKIIKENNYDEYAHFKKITYDLDNDGNTENIYYLDNILYQQDSYYLAIYVQKGNELTSIKQITLSDDELAGGERYDIFGIADIDLDNNYEIVLSSNSGDDSPVYYHFYKYDNGSITELK